MVQVHVTATRKDGEEFDNRVTLLAFRASSLYVAKITVPFHADFQKGGVACLLHRELAFICTTNFSSWSP